MEQKYLQEKDLGPMKLIFNYENIFYSFFYDDVGACVHRSREYAINYVYSGEMVLDNGEGQIHVAKGECVFIPRDHHITLYKKPCNGERYCGIFLSFTRNFLREMYAQGGPYKVPAHTPKLDPAVIKLPKTAEFTSLFSSLLPFFDPEVKPQGDFMHLKMQEGLLALLHIDKRFAPTLFDFNEPWKIDILDFMDKNYMYEFTQEDLAHYTGRSLATFKRDFKKISDPQAIGGGLQPDEGRRAEDSGRLRPSGLQEPIPFLGRVQAAVRRIAHGGNGFLKIELLDNAD